MRHLSIFGRRIGVLAGACLVGVLCAGSVFGFAGGGSSNQPSTKGSLAAAGGDAAADVPAYVQPETCATCHYGIYVGQLKTDMRHAETTGLKSGILLRHPLLRFHEGPYTLQIKRERKSVVYSVSNGQKSISVPILWAFGVGKAGQTYVYKRDGKFYESRVSYFRHINGLDITVGHSRSPRGNLAEELGSPLTQIDVEKCFSCHTSGDVFSASGAIQEAHPGLTCEGCHGSGLAHMEFREMGKGTGGIFNPGHLPPAAVNAYCGRCHRTTGQVLAMNIMGVRDVRFQPYRLELSQCYKPTDRRIDCLACHDPHKPLATDPRWYDAKCLACHAQAHGEMNAVHFAKACPVAKHDCVKCHMPKVEIPGSHFEFTDHDIRIVRPHEPYPG